MGWLGKYQEWRDEWIYSHYMKEVSEMSALI